MKNIRRQALKDTGITLVALVVTIIVLLILAGITINMAIKNNGIMQRAKDASEVYSQAEKNETKQLSEFADSIDELTGKTGLSQDKITAVNRKIREAETLQKLQVAYEAKEITDDETSEAGKGRKVIVEGAYSGTGTDQTFYQSDIGAIGTNKLKWYVLSADERGVNLISEPTKQSVAFYDSPGYDNCLYYLNELSTKLFANEDLGITENRIHAFRLTDIKKAAEQLNIDYKINDNGIERDWNWNLDVIKASNSAVYNNGNVGEKTQTNTNTSYTYYPLVYQLITGTNEVIANNTLYDEKPGEKIKSDGGIKRDEDGNPASILTVTYTDFRIDKQTTVLTRLGRFGNTKISNEIFDTTGLKYIWIASRSVAAGPLNIGYRLRSITGYISGAALCYSNGTAYEKHYPFRVVVSVPGSRVNIAENGTVTLKQPNT